MSPQLEIMLIAMLIAAACALPGVFLVLRRMSMMTDSITHTILLGIVLAFFAVHDLSSPFLIVGAAASGVLAVWLTESVVKTRLLSEDASVGLVFPLLFSIAIILITRYAGSVHLDTDSVLLGELAFAPFDRLYVGGVDIGPRALYTAAGLLVINLTFVLIFYKELKLSAFDPAFAAVLGFAPGLMHYALMTLTSLTAVGAFEAVGSVLVVAFMIGPPVTAYLFTDRLSAMLPLAVLIGAFNGFTGFHFAMLLDVSIAGSMAMMTGITFLAALLAAPRKGVVSTLLRKRMQKIEFAKKTLLFHLYNHETTDSEPAEAGIPTVHAHLHWSQTFTSEIIARLCREGFVTVDDGLLRLTEQGRAASTNAYSVLFSS